MVSAVEICNAALLNLGATEIQSFTDGSPNSKFCNIRYPIARKSELRKHAWNFAVKRQELAQSTTTPVFDYDFRYALPADHLRTLRVANSSETNVYDYKQEAGFIVTSATQIYLRYIFDVTDTTKWDSTFIDLMVARMSYDLSYSITRRRSVWESFKLNYDEIATRTRPIDSTEDVADDLGGDTGDSLIAVRGSGFSG